MITHSNIPNNLINTITKKKFVNPFKLYIFLKRYNSGIVRIDNQCVNDFLFISEHKTKKTFFNNLKKLIQEGFVDYNPKTGWCHIKSFREVCKKWGVESLRSGVVFTDSDYKNFRGFLSASCIKKACALIKYRRKDSGFLMGHPKSYFFGGTPISNSYLGKYIGISKSTARRMKKNMSKSGYGHCFKTLDPTVLDPQTYIEYKAFGLIKPGHYYTIIQGRVFQIMPDKCKASLKFKRRGKKDVKKDGKK